MDDLWNACLQTIKEEVTWYASITKSNPEKIMREMRKGVRPISLQQPIGGQAGLSPAALLFAALCQLKGQLGPIEHGTTQGISKGQKADLRSVWAFVPSAERPACSPPGRGHAQQFAGKLANAVCKLPQEISLHFFHGYPLIGKIVGRTGLLRGYGNAIVAPLAAEFVKAAMAAMADG
jgi:hypothetical protein